MKRRFMSARSSGEPAQHGHGQWRFEWQRATFGALERHLDVVAFCPADWYPFGLVRRATDTFGAFLPFRNCVCKINEETLGGRPARREGSKRKCSTRQRFNPPLIWLHSSGNRLKESPQKSLQRGSFPTLVCLSISRVRRLNNRANR